MSLHFRSALIVSLLSASLSFAASEPKEDAAKSRDVEILMADGSTVRMAMVEESLTVVTRYGKLTVPTHEILRIEIGMPREGAKADKAAAKQPVDKDRAVIKTNTFTIVGKIEEAQIKGKTPYFGDVQVKFADVRSLRSLRRGALTEVTVDATRHCAPGGQQWLDTGVEVDADAELCVTASGKVEFAPGQNQPLAVSGPAGSQDMGIMRESYLCGTLLGRIGESGTPFVIGERYSGKPSTSGKPICRSLSPTGRIAELTRSGRIVCGSMITSWLVLAARQHHRLLLDRYHPVTL